MLTQDYFSAQKKDGDPFQGVHISAAIPQYVPAEHLISKLDHSLNLIAQEAERAEKQRADERAGFLAEFHGVLIEIGGEYPHVEFSVDGMDLPGYEFYLPDEIVKQLAAALYGKVRVTFTLVK